MTINQMREAAKNCMETALTILKREGGLMQMFFLQLADGNLEIMRIPGWASNDGQAKEAISKLLRKRVNAGGVVAIYMVSDMFYTGPISKETHDEIRRRGLNVEGAAAAGLCERHEAVMVSGESPIMALQLVQRYHRPDKAHQDKVELLGEAEEKSGEGYKMSGRFFGYWPQPEKVQ